MIQNTNIISLVIMEILLFMIISCWILSNFTLNYQCVLYNYLKAQLRFMQEDKFACFSEGAIKWWLKHNQHIAILWVLYKPRQAITCLQYLVSIFIFRWIVVHKQFHSDIICRTLTDFLQLAMKLYISVEKELTCISQNCRNCDSEWSFKMCFQT